MYFAFSFSIRSLKEQVAQRFKISTEQIVKLAVSKLTSVANLMTETFVTFILFRCDLRFIRTHSTFRSECAPTHQDNLSETAVCVWLNEYSCLQPNYKVFAH